WAPGRIAATLRGVTPQPAPDGAALRDLMLDHYEAMLVFYGADLGLRVARKHLGWYLDGVAAGAALRERVLRLGDPRAVAREIAAGVTDCGPALGAAA
ncbi:MAG: tRNA-dihydrouridine synthase, partial [Rhodobacteraceae bacterium]|nr:tRNA-dihydrouridine synthase [Paracoccaceae bacterium]